MLLSYKKLFITIFIYLIVNISTAQFPDVVCYHVDHGASERPRNIDVEHMKIEVKILPFKKQVSGKVTHSFKSLQTTIDTIFFDAPGIQIEQVLLDGKKIEFRTNKLGLIAQTKLVNDYLKNHKIEIQYTAFPKKGLYFIGYDQPIAKNPIHQTRRQVWTQGQGIDNRQWIPMIDVRSDKFTTETVVTYFDTLPGYKILSNGTLISQKTNTDKSITWHYKMEKPHAGYLLMLAIDRYEIKKSVSKKGVPHQFWYYPEHADRVNPTSRYSEEILDFLADEIGLPYAWGTYSQVMVQDFLYGAMENTSATVFGDFFWVDERAYLDKNYVSVNAHEATHQWFGDLITGRHDAEQWLQESFATFYPGLTEQHLFGSDYMHWYFRNNMNGAIAAGKQNSLPVRHSASGSSRHYPKGASVLYMLQHQVGRDNFRRAIKYYLEKYQFQTVETWDLQKAFIDATGINVDAFFDQWIHRGGEPKFLVTTQQNSTQSLTFQVNQNHKVDAVVNYFDVPIDFAIYFMDGTKVTKTARVSGPQTQVQFTNLPAGKEVAFCLFDEGSFVLKEAEFVKSNSQWLNQLKYAEFMLDRYDALIALRSAPISEKKSALMEAWKKESFHAIRAEIASQLLEDPQIDAPTAMSIARDKQHQVRMVFAQKIPLVSSTQFLMEELLTDSSYFVIEAALQRMMKHPLYESRFPLMIQKLNGMDGYTHNLAIRYHELIVMGSKLGFLAQSEETLKSAENSMSTLADMAGPMYEFRTRILAIQAIQRLNMLNQSAALAMFDAYFNFNSRLSAPALEAIRSFSNQWEQNRVLQTALYNSNYSKEQKIQLLKILGVN